MPKRPAYSYRNKARKLYGMEFAAEQRGDFESALHFMKRADRYLEAFTARRDALAFEVTQ